MSNRQRKILAMKPITQISEFNKATRGNAIAFSQIIDASAALESFYQTSNGAIVRVLRRKSLHIDSRPAHVQIFDADGRMIRQATKVRETSASFFVRNFSMEINRRECFEIAGRPNINLQTNISSFDEVVKPAEFKLKARCFGVD